MNSRIPLRRRDGTVRAWAVVDADDYEMLAAFRWCLQTSRIRSAGYAARRETGTRRLLVMHRVIMGLAANDPREVDHEDHDGLNNRRENLRIVTHAQQQQNLSALGGSSRFRGVSFHKASGRWRGAVVVGGKQHSVGYFADELDAAHACEAFRDEHMPFAIPDPALA